MPVMGPRIVFLFIGSVNSGNDGRARHEPAPAPRSREGSTMSTNEVIPMTEEGMAKVKAEMAQLEKKRPDIKKAIEEAREKGDLRENADYHAAREELAMLNAKIAQLNGILANAVIIDPAKAPKGKVVMGSTVTFTRLNDGKSMVRTIVGAGQADPTAGRILATSPLAKSMVGHAVGDTVCAELPGGNMDLQIDKIEFL